VPLTKESPERSGLVQLWYWEADAPT